MAIITDNEHEGLVRIAGFKVRLSQCISEYGRQLTIAELIKALQEEQTWLMHEWLKQDWNEDDNSEIDRNHHIGDRQKTEDE